MNAYYDSVRVPKNSPQICYKMNLNILFLFGVCGQNSEYLKTFATNCRSPKNWKNLLGINVNKLQNGRYSLLTQMHGETIVFPCKYSMGKLHRSARIYVYIYGHIYMYIEIYTHIYIYTYIYIPAWRLGYSNQIGLAILTSFLIKGEFYFSLC